MKKHLAWILLLVCLVSLIEAFLSSGLNFANPYGKVPAHWFNRAFWSTLAAWVAAAVGLILILLNTWRSTRT